MTKKSQFKDGFLDALGEHYPWYHLVSPIAAPYRDIAGLVFRL